MSEHELLWAMLADGLDEYFELEKFEKTSNKFRIILKEKNTIPTKIPKQYQGKKVINTVIDDFTFDDFPIRGKKGEIVLRRRSWKFEGVDKMLRRDIDLCANGTKLEKEFADFLKEVDRE